MFKQVQAPDEFDEHQRSIFLAGSIDNGNAIDWQQNLIKFIGQKKVTYPYEETLILNPRRLDWDKEWSPTLDNFNFLEQVEWETKGLETADFIALNLTPNSVSPISLLELGAYLRNKGRNSLVCCSSDYFRVGNVEFFCRKNEIPFTKNLEDFYNSVKYWCYYG